MRLKNQTQLSPSANFLPDHSVCWILSASIMGLVDMFFCEYGGNQLSSLYNTYTPSPTLTSSLTPTLRLLAPIMISYPTSTPLTPSLTPRHTFCKKTF